MIAIDTSKLASDSRLPTIPGALASDVLLTKHPSFAIIILPTDNKQGALFSSPPSDCNLNSCRQSASFRMGPTTSCCPLALAANIRRRRFVMEEWRDISGFPGYQVSSAGSVRSRWKLIFTPRKGNISVIGDEWHSLKPGGKYYSYVSLRKEGKSHWFAVHRLVLQTFVGVCPPGHQACHRDGRRENNQLANLYWGTIRENADDVIRHGIQRGVNNPAAKLIPDDIREIRSLYSKGISSKELGHKFGITPSNVCHIVRRDRWSHIE